MKCALELVATANIVAEKITREKALAEQRKQEERRTRTLAFCEKLGAELENKSLNGQSPTTTFYCNKANYLLKATYSDYADHRLSYRSTEQIDLALLKKWFNEYCFEVKTTHYDYWDYGWGQNWGYKIEIAPAPACL